MELEESSFDFKPVADPRPRVPEPLPVRLIAVADMRVDSPAGLERALDRFYVTLLGMERITTTDAIVYRSENFDLYVDVLEPPVTREDYRPVRVEVKSLSEVQLKFVEAEVEHTRRKGLTPGSEALVLQDPAGNWVEVTESRIIG
jgi:catechol 2,3-dioxygenase-like lactoylglutathione lyase family enzyme